MPNRRQAAAAAAAYVVIAIAWTWPLASGLAHDVAGDFGDPLLNAWILAWDATHLGRGWWNANIFFPHPVALAYSEHLLPQALSILPIYWITANPILCYNLVLLSTFVLSGLGMFLLARAMTGRADAAFVAGVAFAFAPYRIASLPHVQVLSSAWMPFALFGFRRYFETRRLRALAGGSAAWLLQNLSCGYYLIFFTPVVLAYLAWELIVRRAGARVALTVLAACALVAAATAPFLLPYVELRQLGFPPRPLREVVRFSADTFAWFTADPNVRLWGGVARAWPAAEGALFPGLTIAALAVAAALGVRFAAPAELLARRRASPVALLPFLVVAVPLFNLHAPFVRINNVERTLAFATAAAVAIAASSRSLRAATIAWLASPVGFFTLVGVFAFAMSVGPDVHARGRSVAQGVPYALAYWHVPGFDGVRVPARFGMIAAFALAALVPFAVRTRTVAVIACVLIVLESAATPMPMNQNDTSYAHAHLAPLPGRVALDDRRDLDALLAALRPATPIVELPLGEPAFDVRYMLASTRHWKPLVNGYSGGMPADYAQLDQRLAEMFSRPEAAWQALVSTGAAVVVVHEAFFADGRGAATTVWLRAHGARTVARFQSDAVLRLK